MDLSFDLIPKPSASGVWLAAYTRPRHEQRVQSFCEQREIEAFLPTYSSWRRWSDRKKCIAQPLFASYVFLRLDECSRARAVQAPGFLWFVHNRTGPVQVSESELLALKRLLSSGLAYDPLPNAQLGDEVEIVRGVLRGSRGRLIRKGEGGIALEVTAIQAATRVVLPDASWVCKVEGCLSRVSGAPYQRSLKWRIAVK